ncbi:MAG: hypothetical protein JKY01_07770 [Pseudomonadales bacterium]|nr:hypothetical protein [Pseudomonadales bacterium]
MNGFSMRFKPRALYLCFIGLLIAPFITSCDKIENPPLDDAANQSLLFEASSDAPSEEVNFIDHINPIFDMKINGHACSDSACHNQEDGEGGNFRIRPNVNEIYREDERQAAYLLNFLSASAFVSSGHPNESKLLLEPLQGNFPSVQNHGGGDLLNQEDTTYQTIYTWISNPSEQGGM